MFDDKQVTVYNLFAPGFIPGCNASMRPVAIFCRVAVLKRHAMRYLSLWQTELKDQTVCSRTIAPADERLELGEQAVCSRSRAPDEIRLSLPLQQDLAESTHP